MKWTGKIVGLLVGLLTRNPEIIVLGLLLGHLYDIGLIGAAIRPAAKPKPESSAEEPVADPYAVLGVSAGSSETEIEQAYRRRMSEYHPDRVANSADEIRKLAEQRAREINAAYETIQKQRRKD